MLRDKRQCRGVWRADEAKYSIRRQNLTRAEALGYCDDRCVDEPERKDDPATTTGPPERYALMRGSLASMSA